MTSDGKSKDDVKLPEGSLGNDIKTAFEDPNLELLVTVTAAMGEEQVRSSLTLQFPRPSCMISRSLLTRPVALSRRTSLLQICDLNTIFISTF
jgi:hypothetical protein